MFIIIPNSGIDELFDILKGNAISWQKDGKESVFFFPSGYKRAVKYGQKDKSRNGETKRSSS